jgi:hypothetical protein
MNKPAKYPKAKNSRKHINARLKPNISDLV